VAGRATWKLRAFGDSFRPVSKLAIVRDFLGFLAVRKRYWLLPAAVTLLVLGALIALTEGSAIAPFIYTLF
jgi:hypothetical protein